MAGATAAAAVVVATVAASVIVDLVTCGLSTLVASRSGSGAASCSRTCILKSCR